MSPEGMEMAGQNTMDPYQYAQKTVDPSWGETFGKSLGAGFTRLGAGLLDALQWYASGQVYNVDGKLIKTPSYDEMRNDKSNEITKASDLMHETADRMAKEAQPYGGEKGFLDLLWDGEIGKFAQKGLATAAKKAGRVAAEGA